MAVLETHQKRIWRSLVNHCETYCNANKVDLIWFNARTGAVGLYKKMDYQPPGETLTLKTLANIYLMFKKIIENE